MLSASFQPWMAWVMHPEQRERSRQSEESDRSRRSDAGTAQDERFVSGRFLGDFFRALARQDVAVTDLIGDLPIPLGENGDVPEPVEWDHFVEFMRRLARTLGGPAEVERCGGLLDVMKPARAPRSLAGLAASPYALYRAAAGWALHRAMPGVETEVRRADDGQLEIHARIADGLRACPEILHFATGGARILPRAIGLPDAVVVADIGEREAHYRIAVPPSKTLRSRIGRVIKTVFSAGNVLRFLEAQQLELHAKNEALRKANEALEASESRYRALVDTAIDVLCEIDRTGRLVYVSASVERLIGYSPEQVTGSHYRLWIPREWHDRVDEVVNALFDLPSGRATQELIRLHGAGGEPIFAEMTARTYDTREGERRIVSILRDRTERAPIGNTRQPDTAPLEQRGLDLDEAEPESLTEIIERALGDDTALFVEGDEGVAVAPYDADKDGDEG